MSLQTLGVTLKDVAPFFVGTLKSLNSDERCCAHVLFRFVKLPNVSRLTAPYAATQAMLTTILPAIPHRVNV